MQKLTSEFDQVSTAPISWSPDGNTVAFHSEDGRVKLLSLSGGPAKTILEDLRDSDSDLAWSPNGKELAYASKGKIYRVSLGDGKTQEVQTGLDATVQSYLAWSPDGKTIAFSARQGGELQFWLVSDFLPLVPPKR